MPHDVIISYARSDKLTADAVCAKLEARNIRCWIAPRDILPGDNDASAILDAVDGAKILVLILSSHANASSHVMREVERAVHDAIPIIPFRIEDVQPSRPLQYFIGPQHWLDALTPPLEAHILKLADTVTLLLSKATPPAKRPPSESKIKRWFPLTPKRTIVLSAAILIAISVIAAGYYASTDSAEIKPSLNTGAASNGMVVYQNASTGVSFTYPNIWNVATYSINATNTTYFKMTRMRYNNSIDNYYLSIEFHKEKSDRYVGSNDSETLSNKIQAEMYNKRVIYSTINVTQDPTPTMLGGLPAYEGGASYVDFHDNRTYNMEWICTLKGDDLYIINYYGSVPQYYDMRSVARDIFASFKFL